MMRKLGLCLFITSLAYGGEMIAVRKGEDRGHAELGWLSTQYTFSFSDYYDSRFMGFKTLRVMNEDIVAPTKGFDTHPHDNMEILTYILEGTLEHKDTMGNHSQIHKGEFQLMTAGTGVKHSEFNPSKKEKVHLMQIWIYPEKKGLKPEYQQTSFPDHRQGLKLVVSPEGKEGALKIHQNAEIYLGRFAQAEEMQFPLKEGRSAWIQVISGEVRVNDRSLKQGDGISLEKERVLKLGAEKGAELLLFDLI
jgi:redox-sensitive bicupin YhaK (pirin superfamily)